jgi:purine catabolism regulator
MTVADVISLPVVQQGGPEVCSDRRFTEAIRWVHVSDVDDLSHLLQGGELVFTTGSALVHSPARYLEGLAAVGAIGVVVELGTHVASLPKAVSRIAESLDLALIALHHEIKFVEVTEAVHRMIVSEQYEEVAFDRRVHESFTELGMKRASLPSIVDAAAAILGEPIVLEDLGHQALAASGDGEGAAITLRDWERRSRLHSGDRREEESWMTTAVGLRSEEWGRLIIPRTPADPARAKKVLERASAALAMHRMIEHDQSRMEHQAQSGLIDDVLRNRITDGREVTARAHALGLRSAALYLPAVVQVERMTERLDPVAGQRRNARLLESVAHTVNASGHTGLFSIRRDRQIGVILALHPNSGSGAAKHKALSRLGEDLRRETLRTDAARNVVFAVAEAAEDLADAIHGLTQAAHIAEVASTMTSNRRPTYFQSSDVRLRGLLSALRDDPRVQGFAETELKALINSDIEGTVSNVAVLREYLKAAGNKVAAAKQLHISRPALYKRLTAIEQILDVDLDDGESMTSLYVALLILDTAQRSELPGTVRSP